MTDVPTFLLPRPARVTLLTLSMLLGLAGAQQTAPPTTVPTPPPSITAPASLPPSTAADLTPLLAALRGSPEWRAADLSYRAAQLTLDSARTRAGLSVTAGADGTLSRVPWDSGSVAGATTLTLNARLNVLPWAPALEGARSAERALAGAAVELRGARARLTVQALQAYEGVRAASAGLELAGAQLDVARAQLSAAQAQRADGVLSAEGLLAQQSAFETAQAAQSRAERALAQALRSLNRLLGAPAALPAR
ncbi:TolC family protein, partial [Deinococcus sp.]|uniref:TolC family protein n=1 Tax=Deinococcus sp. TaxID=47478 RepID=UPI0025C37E3B